MKRFDIGIDLGTTSVVVYSPKNGIILKEPSVVAVDVETQTVVAVGAKARIMVGKTPAKIKTIAPMKDGVISDFDLTEIMLKHFIRETGGNFFVKPRVALCIPAITTEVEKRATQNAALGVGARKVFLVEEPIAAAIGCGIDISIPNGQLIVDIGGGTTDIALLSLNGVVQSSSVKMAGVKIDKAIIQYVRYKYGILLGEKIAEQVKKDIVNLDKPSKDDTADVKGRHLLTGLPHQMTLNSVDMLAAVSDEVAVIIDAIQQVIAKSPPELVGDIYTNGITLTGGGALIRGLPEHISKKIGVKVIKADNPLECVAIGTGKVFEYIDKYGEHFLADRNLIY